MGPGALAPALPDTSQPIGARVRGRAVVPEPPARRFCHRSRPNSPSVWIASGWNVPSTSLRIFQRLLEQRLGLIEVATLPDHGRQATEGDSVIGVAVSEDIFADFEDLAEQPLGLPAVIQEEAKLGQHAQAGGIIGVASPQDLGLQPEQLSDHRLGQLVFPLLIQAVRLAMQPAGLRPERVAGIGELEAKDVPGKVPSPWRPRRRLIARELALVAAAVKLVRSGRDHDPWRLP